MNDLAELQLILADELIAPDEKDCFLEEARSRDLSPIDLLVEKKVISPLSAREMKARLADHYDDETKDARIHAKTVDPDSLDDFMASMDIVDDSMTWPVTTWTRYQPIGFLGRGGMGKVFQVWDTHLKRNAAIKFLTERDQVHVQRFMNEARAQARVDHEHICKIYEAGEIEGKPYIAMQYVDGEPLHKAATAMSPEQKLTVMKSIAYGVHEAHRMGLIHRDLKPGNIMVETGEDGRLKPYVLDFGLARSQADSGLTIDGALLGTPSYMPPEQVRGDLQQLDRRSDVYALGATMYHILSGDPPYHGKPHSQVLVEVLEQDPVPLDKNVPADVETIVAKCMEKEQARRYDSARALAEDLGRYLDGEPILARPGGLMYRLGKKARKHKLAFSVAAIGILLLAMSLVWGSRQVWIGQERARLTREMGRLADEVESLARFSYMAPKHDISGDKVRLAKMLDNIRNRMAEAGRLANGPGYYALGRGLLAQGELLAAREALENAWRDDYQGPDAAFALGRSLGELFRQAQRRALLFDNKVERERALAEATVHLREPALNYLELASASELASGAYLHALTAFYNNQEEEALELAAQARDERPWFYEAWILEGDIRLERALSALENETTQKITELGNALLAYTQASEIAPSNPEIYASIATVQSLQIHLDLFEDRQPDEAFAKGIDAIDMSLSVSPDYADGWLNKAILYRSMAQKASLKIQNAGALRAEALDAAICATWLREDHGPAWLEQGAIHWLMARRTQERGENPTVSYRAAIAALDKVAPSEQNYKYHITMGLSLLALDQRGDSGAFDRAIDAFDKAIALQPDRLDAWSNKGAALFQKSGAQPNEQGQIWLDEAINAFHQASLLNPNHFVPFYYLGRAWKKKGDWVAELSQKKEAAYTEALSYYRKGIELNPRLVHLHSGVGAVYSALAQAAWGQGSSPFDLLNSARKAYLESIEVAPKFAFSYQNLGWAWYYEGKYKVRSGDDGSQALLEAINQSEKALELRVSRGARLCIASSHRMLYEHTDSEDHFQKALEGFQALLKEKQDPEASRSLGRLWTQKALSTSKSSIRSKALKKARVFLTEAEVFESDQAHFMTAWARWTLVSNEELEWGHQLASQAAQKRFIAGRALKSALEIRMKQTARTSDLAALIDQSPRLRHEFIHHLPTEMAGE